MNTLTTLPELTKNRFLNLVYSLNKKGGPDIPEYKYLNTCINFIPHMLKQEIINSGDIEKIKEESDFLKNETSIMGHIKMKPFGYARDYLIIERIYERQLSEKYFKWDQYSMNNAAAKAVRNRKEFFKHLIAEKLRKQETIHLLNVASGPSRDLKEVYDQIDPKRLKTTCVEIDTRAIEYSKKICCNYLERIEYVNQNIFKFQNDEKYDLVWSAGLFDYFNDKSFIQLLKKFQNNLKETGEVVVGNFSKNNPSRIYMEVFGEWFLNHRNEEELTELAIQSGVEKYNIRIDKEPLGVNLFLRIKNNILYS